MFLWSRILWCRCMIGWLHGNDYSKIFCDVKLVIETWAFFVFKNPKRVFNYKKAGMIIQSWFLKTTIYLKNNLVSAIKCTRARNSVCGHWKMAQDEKQMNTVIGSGHSYWQLCSPFHGQRQRQDVCESWSAICWVIFFCDKTRTPLRRRRGRQSVSSFVRSFIPIPFLVEAKISTCTVRQDLSSNITNVIR